MRIAGEAVAAEARAAATEGRHPVATDVVFSNLHLAGRIFFTYLLRPLAQHIGLRSGIGSLYQESFAPAPFFSEREAVASRYGRADMRSTGPATIAYDAWPGRHR
jgi:hypothetical protein